jgi:hypothetical protein
VLLKTHIKQINEYYLNTAVMKTIRKNMLLLFLFIGSIGLLPQKTTAQTSVSFQLFYDNLSVSGSWINDPNYGYVWSPNVGVGFAPYRTNGYWVYTEVGWTWVSNYAWGWAPFHYGRWYYDPYYGWLWSPDYEWGPAWVTWRYYDGYYGWAPIGPGISIDVAFSNIYTEPYDHWVFVRERDVCQRNLGNYYVNKSNYPRIIKNSTVINNIQSDKGVRYNAGPGRDHVQKRIGTAIPRANLKDMDKPGQRVSKNELRLYKPNIGRGDNNHKAAPSRVMGQKDIKPISERRTEAKVNKPIQRPKVQRVEQPNRPQGNVEPKAVQRQPEMQRSEQRAKEQQMERRQEAPINPPREIEKKRNELPAKPQLIEPPLKPEIPQRGNGNGQNPMHQKPEPHGR